MLPRTKIAAISYQPLLQRSLLTMRTIARYSPWTEISWSSVSLRPTTRKDGLTEERCCGPLSLVTAGEFPIAWRSLLARCRKLACHLPSGTGEDWKTWLWLVDEEENGPG